MDPQIFQKGVQRTPKFENLDTSLCNVIKCRFESHNRKTQKTQKQIRKIDKI